MLRIRFYWVLLAGAIVLGMALGRERQNGLRIHMFTLGAQGRGAQEPSLLLPGPQLLWWQGDELRGLQLETTWTALAPDQMPKTLPQGNWTFPTWPSPITQFSSSSLRNGTMRNADGHITGWSPSIQRDAAGQVHAVFDRYGANSYDVVYRQGGAEQVLAASSAMEAHASLALDGDRLWVAWDEGSTHWGQGAGLHEQRKLRLLVREQGRWQQVNLPELSSLLTEDGELAAPYLGLAELPRLAVDDDHCLWMFFRVMRPFTAPASRSASRQIAWVIRAMRLSEDGWSAPLTLPQSDGPNHDTLAILPLSEGGLLAAWTGDGRLQHFAAMKVWGEPVMQQPQLHVARLDAPTAKLQTIPGLSEWQLPPNPGPPSQTFSNHDPNPQLGVEGFVRLWGDLHRHSDLSRCSMDIDGSVPDHYRYAAGPGGLDFVAITDHHQHLSEAAWSFLLRTTQRFLDSPQFLPMFGFEYAFPDGHRNLIFGSYAVAIDAPLLSRQGADIAQFDAKDYVAIPHQIAEEKTILNWSAYRPDLETEMEIFQRRGSYEQRNGFRVPRRAQEEEKFVVDYLLEDRQFGFLASSDHKFSNGAFAVVYARSRSRAAIMEALRARRSYAATAKIALDVHLGSLMMGEEGAVSENAELVIDIDAGTNLARVEVIRNGQLVKQWSGQQQGQAWQQGLLTLRFGKIPNQQSLPLHAKGLKFGTAFLMDGEEGVASHAESTWSPDIWLDYVSQRPQSMGGWVVPVRLEAPLEDIEVSLGNGKKRPRWNGLELREGSEWKKQYWGKPVSLHLAPPPLAQPEFHQRWQGRPWRSGDWVYVRVVREDGAMAWSSPIWVE